MNYVAKHLGNYLIALGAIFMFLAPSAVSAHHVERVVVEHYYPQGVTRHGGPHGSRHYHHGGHYGPNTCYRECFHQPRYGHGRGHKRGHYRHGGGHHGGTSIQFGVSVGGYSHHGYQSFSFGIATHR